MGVGLQDPVTPAPTIFTFGIGAIPAIFLWLYVYRWGRYSRGRRSSKFWVDREGITTPEDEYLARADIARLYVWAPGREPAFLHAGLASTGTLTGPGTGERSLLGIADRAWMLVAEAGGREHWLAGGMRQVTAYGVLHEISRVFAGTAQPGI